MKRLILFIGLLTFLKCYGQTPSNDPHWQFVWGDEFDFFDNTKWAKANYCDHYGETVLNLEQNVWTSTEGNLVIKIDNNPTNCPANPPLTLMDCGGCTEGIHNFTSGWVENISSLNIQFGYVEARIKFPYGKGLWPAFWTFLGADLSNWSNSAEIDIAEILGDLSSKEYLQQNFPADQIFTTNIHLRYCEEDSYDYVYDPDTHEGTCTDLPDYFSGGWMSSYADWHTYAIEWSPSKIIWYIDDYPIRIFSNHNIIDPVRIIMGVGVLTDKDKHILTDESTPFPSYMYVDFMHVYKLNKDCNDFIDATNYDFSTYNNIEKNYIRKTI